jgi:hypothetical protein
MDVSLPAMVVTRSSLSALGVALLEHLLNVAHWAAEAVALGYCLPSIAPPLYRIVVSLVP